VSAVAFLCGATVVVVALLGWRVPVAHGGLGASATVSVPLTGELAVAPLHPLDVDSLAPGPRPARAQATFTLRNQTGRDLALVVHGAAPAGDLDGVLRVEVDVDGGPALLSGTLAQVRRARPLLDIARGQMRQLAIRVWVPASVHDGYVGRTADLTLNLVDPGGPGR
jgi:hypothetical protein